VGQGRLPVTRWSMGWARDDDVWAAGPPTADGQGDGVAVLRRSGSPDGRRRRGGRRRRATTRPGGTPLVVRGVGLHAAGGTGLPRVRWTLPCTVGAVNVATLNGAHRGAHELSARSSPAGSRPETSMPWTLVIGGVVFALAVEGVAHPDGRRQVRRVPHEQGVRSVSRWSPSCPAAGRPMPLPLAVPWSRTCVRTLGHRVRRRWGRGTCSVRGALIGRAPCRPPPTDLRSPAMGSGPPRRGLRRFA